MASLWIKICGCAAAAIQARLRRAERSRLRVQRPRRATSSLRGARAAGGRAAGPRTRRRVPAPSQSCGPPSSRRSRRTGCRRMPRISQVCACRPASVCCRCLRGGARPVPLPARCLYESGRSGAGERRLAGRGGAGVQDAARCSPEGSIPERGRGRAHVRPFAGRKLRVERERGVKDATLVVSSSAAVRRRGPLSEESR